MSCHATAPHQFWFADVRYLVKIDGHWLYSILIFEALKSFLSQKLTQN
jgi:hypothetical protein